MARKTWCFMIKTTNEKEAKEKAYSMLEKEIQYGSSVIDAGEVLTRQEYKERGVSIIPKWGEDQIKQFESNGYEVQSSGSEFNKNSERVGIFRADTKEAQWVIDMFGLDPMLGGMSPYSDGIFTEDSNERLNRNDPRLKSSEYFAVPVKLHY
jgi:hypothetical protein